MMGGAVVAFFFSLADKSPRLTVNTWSCAATQVPPTEPVTQRSGKGLGQSGSTWKLGTSVACWACAVPENTCQASKRISAPVILNTHFLSLAFIKPSPWEYRQIGFTSESPSLFMELTR